MKQPGSQSYGGGQPYGGGYQVPYNPYMPGQTGGGQQQFQPQQQQQQMPFPAQAYTVNPGGSPLQTSPSPTGQFIEQSYIENILRLNRGKLASVYMTFEGSKDGNTKLFKGIIEAAGRDHVILSDPQTGMRYLLPLIYLDYVTFDEEIEYSYPIGSPTR